MAATLQDIREWLHRSKQDGHDFVIMVCDTYDYSDYPVSCTEGEFKETYDKYKDGKNMQKIMEVYDLSLDIESQLNEHRAFHYPASFSKDI